MNIKTFYMNINAFWIKRDAGTVFSHKFRSYHEIVD